MLRKYLEGVLGNLWNDFCMYLSRMHSALYRPLQTISKSSTVTCQESVRAPESLLWKSEKQVVCLGHAPALLGVVLSAEPCLPMWLLPRVFCPGSSFRALGLPPGADPEVSPPLPFLLKLPWSSSLSLKSWVCFVFARKQWLFGKYN